MRRLPSPATCIALLALFVSLGGTAYAVTALPRNSVGAPQLRARAVTEQKLANDAVVTAKLANGAVRGAKIAPASIAGSRIAPDALGGDQIDEGALGPVPVAREAQHAAVADRALVAERVERIDTVARAERAALADRATRADHAEYTDRTGVAESLAAVDTNYATATLASDEIDTLVVDCDPGLVPVGGGLLRTGGNGIPQLLESGALVAGWRVSVYNAGGSPLDATAMAICVRAGRT